MRYLFLYGGAIGDTLLGIHLGRVLVANKPGAKLLLVSTRKSQFARELAATVPFVTYVELPNKSIASWFRLITFIFSSWKSAVYDPFNNPLSLWWKVILWCASFNPRSVEVHCRIREGLPLKGKRRVVLYDPKQTGKLFDTQAAVLEAWGITASEKPQPKLEAPLAAPAIPKPYIVFHFFAGHVRRSIPVDHAHSIIAAARAQFPHHVFILTCGVGEEADALRVAKGISNTEIKSNLSARELLALLAKADVVAGTASGVIHMAAHLNVPTVALCNLSDPCWLPAYNPEVAMLSERRRCKCNGDKTGECGIETPEGIVYACLYDITTESVINAMKDKIHA